VTAKKSTERDDVELREDGTRHLIRPALSPIKQKILSNHADWKQKAAVHEEVKIRRIAFKKEQQRKKGWPADKSPV
jgi:hypothetical protein